MDKEAILALVESLIRSQKINYEIKETKENKYIMYYDDENKIFFVNIKNIEEGAKQLEMSLDTFINIVVSHEIGHYIDLGKNRDKYKKINDKANQKTVATIKNSASSREASPVLESIIRESKKADLLKEERAWNEGLKIVNPVYKNQYLKVKSGHEEELGIRKLLHQKIWGFIINRYKNNH